jgi:hypothetical protein
MPQSKMDNSLNNELQKLSLRKTFDAKILKVIAGSWINL